MDNVIKVQFKPDPKEELISKLLDLVYEYAEQITCAEAIGIVELVKYELINNAENDEGGDSAS